MRIRKSLDLWRCGLLFVLLCIMSFPILAGAAPLAQIPTGPLSAYNGIPDYYTTANWANSPPLAKFVNTLAPLGCTATNNIGQCIPVAVPDTTTFPGSDYYIIELREYSERMHSDLNPTKLRGYVQLKADGTDQAPPHNLGPIVVATKDRPVRIKFINGLPTGAGGNLFIPVDESVMGAGEGPIPGEKFTQNRAAIHLHGGRTPWISDGTPHQWITPAGENTPYVQGVSVQNVPDMCFDTSGNAIPRATDPDCLTGSSNPGPGATTYYFTNQQSTRLMFYHDHAFGITRLNVYAGEAAGYVITDPIEQDLIDRGIIPGTKSDTTLSMGGMIPLIIQDKTFVNADVTAHPSGGGKVMTVRETDPLWNWGSAAAVNGVVPPVTGDLWLPHVYMPAQLPTGSSTGGVNPFGRWMYGPWFYPATAITHGPVANPYYDPNCSSADPFVFAQCETPGQPPLIPGTPNVSMGMEAFQDSAVVNGTVFPTLTVDPKAYRFRILNAASDRFQNLSFYVADPAQISPDTRPASRLTEVKTVPASAELAAANNWPADWPVDGRDGGVPDPGACLPGGVSCPNLGPSFLQIGTEGGFLPAPTVRAPQPVTYITDPTAFWVGVVDKTGLALGPAERADVIVDFSAYAGKTLILYNDAPAAWPARVPGYDYYTGAPDMRDSGGYGTGGTFNPATGAWEGGTGPLVGYAPNTRTVMQVIVNSGTPASFNATVLENEFTSAAPVTGLNPDAKTLFERSQEPIIVGQAAYSSAYPNSYFPLNFPWEGITQMNDEFLQFVTLAGEQVKVSTEPKGIHDEMGASFDPEYGRMSGNLAMQLPNATTLNANLVLYGFSDLPTEYVNNSTTVDIQVLPNANPLLPGTLTDGTQIWKISHNGVDTHPIHFHIFDVQLINRVGWDGQIAMPEANELGWKDTIKISPLMDTIVAVRPRAPALPFGIPNSLRPLNPAIPIDSAMGFTNPTPGSDWPFFSNIDWVTGQAYIFNPGPPAFPYDNYKGVVTNVLHNFGWEYVWHCHILSHEEMDMMRPIVLKVDTMLPPAFAASATPGGGKITVTWNDPTPINYETYPVTFGSPANEVGFNVYRSTNGVDFTKLNNVNLPANSTSFADISPVTGGIYKVEAFNAKGSTFTPVVSSIVVTVAVNNLPLGTAPATAELRASISGLPAGITITSVDFYNGTTLLGTDATAPYRYIWTNVMGGVYSVTARITDSRGVVTASAPLGVIVNGTLTADFTISGSASGLDVGFCENVTLTSTSTGTGIDGWSWSSGGGSSTETLLSSLPGTYPVTLTVSDSGTGETASVTKNVVIVNHNPTAIPGGPYTIVPGGSLTLNGSGTDLQDACNTTPLTYAWNVDSKGNYDYFTANPTISYAVLNSVLGAGTHTMTFKVTDSNGGVGTASTTVTLVVPPVAPVATSPTGSSATNAAFTFTGVANATGYMIWLQDFTTATGGAISFTPAQAGCTAGTACSYTPVTPLTATHSYGWQVTAVNSAGQGPWSAPLYFTVVTAPVALTPTAPTGSGIASTAPFTFTGVTNATGYMIWLQDFTTATGGAISFTPAQAGCTAGTACSYTPATPLTATHSYGWQVTAVNSAGEGPWSAPLYFTVVTAPVALTPTAPTGSGIATTAPFTFTGVTNATGYMIWLQDFTTATGGAISFTPAQAGCTAGTACSYTPVTPLTATHSYGWQVTAVNSAGEGPWSAPLYFIVP